MSDGRFGATIVVSTTVRLALMYATVHEWEHVRWSRTRF